MKKGIQKDMLNFLLTPVSRNFEISLSYLKNLRYMRTVWKPFVMRSFLRVWKRRGLFFLSNALKARWLKFVKVSIILET